MRVSVHNFRDDPMFLRIECVVAELLAKGNVVAPVDVLIGMGLLRPEHLNNWRRGRVPYLERVINCNLTRLSRLLRILRFHAHDLNLKPSADGIQTLRQRPQATAALQQDRRRRPRGGLRDAFRMAGQAAVPFGANRAGATDRRLVIVRVRRVLLCPGTQPKCVDVNSVSKAEWALKQGTTP